MIIRTHVDISQLTSASKKAEVSSDAIVKEEVKKEEFVPKKKNHKKLTPTPAIEEPVVEVIEEEKIDLSEWLKEEE